MAPPSIFEVFVGEDPAILTRRGIIATWAVVLAVGFLIKSTFNRRNGKYRYPNLIPGLPIFGNAFQIPADNQGPYMAEVAKKAGDMHTMMFNGTPWVFLNSLKAVHDLLDKKAAIYSDRLNLPMAHDLVSGGHRLLLMPYGQDWRRQRKAMHQILASTKTKMFEPFQDIESRALLFHYLQQPERWWQANERYANSIILSVTYGKRSDLGDPDLKAVLDNAECFQPYLVPGQCIVDNFPWLLKLPIPKSWQPWRWWGDAAFQRTRATYKKMFDDFLERRRLETQKPCFMTEFMDNNQNGEFTEDECYFTAGTLIEAGSDTTRVSIMVVFAGALLFPDWVERAQKQLDSVCGSRAERLPEFSDMNHLPLIKAIIKESLRWKPTIAPTGIPHALTKDDAFGDYRLPAGTVVTYNSWAISHFDYDEPQRFYPERFLDADLDVPTKGHMGFGYGNSVAWYNLLVALSRILYCFDVQPVKDEPLDVSSGLDGRNGKAPFKVKLTPRSEAHAQLILTECTEAADLDNL